MADLHESSVNEEHVQLGDVEYSYTGDGKALVVTSSCVWSIADLTRKENNIEVKSKESTFHIGSKF